MQQNNEIFMLNSGLVERECLKELEYRNDFSKFAVQNHVRYATSHCRKS